MWRLKTGIALCHCVASCAAAALDIKRPLRCSIECPVGNVSKDGYFCTAVYPASIIGGTAFGDYLRTRHSHAPESLTCRAFNRNLNGFPFWPDAAANAVLAVGDDLDFTSAVKDRLLYLLFQDTRRDPFFACNSVYYNGFRDYGFGGSFFTNPKPRIPNLCFFLSTHNLFLTSLPLPYRLCLIRPTFR